MDLIGLILVFFGIVAICMGIYELAKHKVVGRSVSASTPEQIEKFSKIDGICYLTEGISAILLAYSDYIPLLSGSGRLIPAIVIFAVMIINFIAARKILNNFPAEKPDQSSKQD